MFRHVPFTVLCVLQVVGSESGGIYQTPLHFRNSGAVEVTGLNKTDGCSPFYGYCCALRLS